MNRTRKIRFRFGDDVVDAEIAYGKLTQLRTACRALMLDMEQRKEWARCVIALTPHLPKVLHPASFTWHCFDKFQRNFILRYDVNDDVWVLNFCNAPEENPPADKARGEPPGAASEWRACAARMRRAPRRARPEAVLRWGAALVRREWRSRRHFVASAREALRRRLELVGEVLRRERERLVRRGAAIGVAVRESQSRVRAIVEKLKGAPSETAAYYAFSGAYLEGKRITLAPGVTLSLNTFVPDRIDWDAFPFGEPIQEEHALA